MKGLNPDGKTAIVESMVQACEAAREKAARRKFVAQLASHLCMVFHIKPNEQALVMTLCGGNGNNNLEALKYWIDKKLNDENKAAKTVYWEGELSKLLNDALGFT